VLSKEFIKSVYIDREISRSTLKKHYPEITDKIFHNSYNFWFTDEERKEIGSFKKSIAQKRSNSNSVNTGKPRCLLPMETLKECLDNCYSLERMSRVFHVAPQTVKYNLEYYGMVEDLVNKGMDYDRLIACQFLDKVMGTTILEDYKNYLNYLSEDSCNKLLNTFITVDSELNSVRHTMLSLRKNVLERARRNKVNLSKYKLPSSKLNGTVSNILDELNIEHENEFEIEGRYFDFIIVVEGKQYLLEIDSVNFHSTEQQLANDILKNDIAKRNKYNLVRLEGVGKDKKATIKKKLEKCLNNLKLEV
jgi:hypothetical protein